MEESTSYTLQEIEKLKLKISGYRNTLMTLKKDTSIEDLQMMNREFNELKLRLSYIEGLTKTMELNQYSQNEMYEEQVKQLTLQIASLNKTVEEMGLDILTISNKLIQSRDEEMLEKTSATITNETYEKKLNTKGKYIHDLAASKNQTPAVSNQPTYIQLRNLTKQVIQLQKNEESIAPIEQADYQGSPKEQRYFNHRYFQPLNNQPNHSLNKNSAGPSPFQFKNLAKNEDRQLNDIGESYGASNITLEPEKSEQIPSAESVNESTNISSTLNVVESESISEEILISIVNESNNEDAIGEEQNQFQVEPESELPSEELIEQTKSLDDKNWKSSFFNIFRK